ncbi:MAG: hypothetical protein KC593_02155 [Myxococcales bacterium]|nr:hypothetical protein [Myxococcales bacterium]MCB9627753.1 VWA domain-containing protein [Sandaracinaceae bacterium]
MTDAAQAKDPLHALRDEWLEAWPAASTVFSRFTRLRSPIFCLTEADERREELVGSFAMIRLTDLAVVISLRQVKQRGLESFSREILAHEVGHHVHAPGNLRDQGRLLARTRFGLGANLHAHAPLVANLYADLLLNDRLARSAGLNMAGVYEALKVPDPDPLWTLYMRTYERLWSLTTGTLGRAEVPATIERDADLSARIVRIFRSRWLEGAASFARIVREYLLQAELEKQAPQLGGWLDTTLANGGEEIPDGLVEDEAYGGPMDGGMPAHPSEDPSIAGDLGTTGPEPEGGSADGKRSGSGPGKSKGGAGRPDQRPMTRTPAEYVSIMKALAVKRDPKDLVAHYYKELARGRLIPFPVELQTRAGDPLPEGLELWEPGSSLERIDWIQTLLQSPVVIPGVSTVERSYGVTEGGDPERKPPDLYVGVDCSGSMANPAQRLSYPALAGTVILLSALRAGARAMVCLSGEWHGQGTFKQTPGFIRDERALLGVLTDYLGTGASFGLPRLQDTFVASGPLTRKTHILVVSDSDLFREIDGTANGWETLATAVRNAGGGATAALNLSTGGATYAPFLDKLRAAGMEPHIVSNETQLVDFARAFARRTYAADTKGRQA